MQSGRHPSLRVPRDVDSGTPHPGCLPAPLPASWHSWMEKPAVGKQGCRNKGAIAVQTLSNRKQSPAALTERQGREIRFTPLR